MTILLLVLDLLLPASAARAQAGSAAVDLAITNATIADVETGHSIAGQTVLIADGRITRIGPAGEVPIPPGSTVVDGRGAWLIPGLWDMHTHLVLYGELAMRLMIAHGVTGARDMGGHLDRLVAWRNRIDAGALVGPRIRTAGPTLDGVRFPGAIGGFRVHVATREQGRRVVDSLADLGVDLIKVHSYLSREAYLGIAEAARRRHLPFAGHNAASITLEELARAGQRSLEHHFGLPYAGAPGGERIRQTLADSFDVLRKAGESARTFVSLNYQADSAATDGYVPGQGVSRFRVLAEHGVYATPTLATLRVLARGNEPAIRDDPRNRFIPKSVLANLDPAGDPNGNATAADLDRGRARFAKWLAMFADVHEAGVQFLAGTDMGVRSVFPGASLHDELVLLTEAGLSNLEALQAATRNAAASLGMLDQAGTIAPGKLADLVLLDADPLEDIRATARIRAVIAGGRLYDRKALDSLLSHAERTARDSR